NQIEILTLLGAGIVVISSVLSYGFVIAGKLRCLMNAPERCAAKWLMFCCILCLVTGPALNLLSSISGEGAQNIKQLKKGGKQGIAQLQFKGPTGIMQLASMGLNACSFVLFLLFLRAVARCFSAQVCTVAIYLFLGFSGILLALTIQLAFDPLKFEA